MRHFVSEPITACHPELVEGRPTVEGIANEPTLPAAFRWRDQTLEIKTVLDRRRSTKVDRGDTYLKRHWFDLETSDGRIVTVYYDRAVKRGQPHWWLYAIEE